MSCEKHPTEIEGKLPYAFAKQMANLRYDALQALLLHLALELDKDSAADLERGRKKLAGKLHSASNHIASAANDIGDAWSICIPFMDPTK